MTVEPGLKFRHPVVLHLNPDNSFCVNESLARNNQAQHQSILSVRSVAGSNAGIVKLSILILSMQKIRLP